MLSVRLFNDMIDGSLMTLKYGKTKNWLASRRRLCH